METAFFSDETLKEISEKKETELLWTRELESVRLTRDYSKHQAFARNFKISPEAVAVANIRTSAVYPSLPGFGSLDNSAVSTELAVFLDGLCRNVSEWNLSAVMMEQNSVFSAVLFKYDIESSWRKTFGVPFPEEFFSVSSNDVSSDNAAAERKKQKLFDGWIYGRPFFSEDSIHVPVRFLYGKGYADVVFYIKNEKDYVVQNIEIQKMQG